MKHHTWQPKETTTHQDHVIAHVLGATVLGYFVFDEALYILLDIGFIWTIFLDGEMGLLPHPVAVSELEMDSSERAQIKADIDHLLANSAPVDRLLKLQRPQVECQIKDVSFFAAGDHRRLMITGEEANLAIETSMITAEILVYES
ncbi:MAG TPA: hypothetical protein VIF64_22250 [Pyrinomonadaceae bacterium]